MSPELCAELLKYCVPGTVFPGTVSEYCVPGTVSGEDAADAYVTELDAVMLRALEYPLMGADCSEVRKGYRRIRAGGQMIYYIPHQRGIDVMRVMHPRQHAREHLKE